MALSQIRPEFLSEIVKKIRFRQDCKISKSGTPLPYICSILVTVCSSNNIHIYIFNIHNYLLVQYDFIAQCYINTSCYLTYNTISDSTVTIKQIIRHLNYLFIQITVDITFYVRYNEYNIKYYCLIPN
jgi:hypothetical protein